MKLNRIRTLLAGCLLIPAAMTQAAVNVAPAKYSKGQVPVVVRVEVFSPTCSMGEFNKLQQIDFGTLSPADLSNNQTIPRDIVLPFTCPRAAINQQANFYVRVNGNTSDQKSLDLTSVSGDEKLAQLLKIQLYGGKNTTGTPLKLSVISNSNIQDEVRNHSANLPFSQQAPESWFSFRGGDKTQGELHLTAVLLCKEISNGGTDCNNLPPGTVRGSAFITMEYF